MSAGDGNGTVALLRAVNITGRMFPAADIRRVVSELGMTDVASHINTGNVFFRGGPSDRGEIEALLERAFTTDRGFDVPVIAFTPAEFARVAADVDELTDDSLDRHYVYLLKDELGPDALAAIAARQNATGRVVVRGRAAHVLIADGYRPGQVDPLGVAKLFGVATNRNRNVVRALAAKWS